MRPVRYRAERVRAPFAAPLGAVAALVGGLVVGACTLDTPILQLAANDGGARGVGASVVSASARGAKAGTRFGDYLAGRHAELHRETGAAASYVLKVLEADPENLSLMRRGLNLLVMEDRWDEAVALAKRLSGEDPEAQIGSLVLFVDAVRGNRLKAAEKRIEAMPQGGLNALLQPMLLAWVRLGLNDRDGALKALAPLAGNSRFRPLYDLHAGLIHDFLGLNDEAARLYRTVGEESAGSSFRIAQLVGSFLERTGRADEAARLYLRLTESRAEATALPADLLKPGSGLTRGRPLATPVHGMAEALLGLGNALSAQGASDIGLVLARLSARLRPDLVFARLLIADIFELQRRFEAAQAVLVAIPADSPFYWPAQLRMATNLRRLDRADEAVARLSLMADERAERPDALILLGDVLRGEKRFGEAVAAYDRAFERLPEIGAENWLLLYHRGIALERSRQWPRAEKDFLAALDLNPDQPLVLNYLGYSWVEKGLNLDRAQRMIERAVELRPNDGFIVDSLGWVLFQFGQFERAARELERAVELEPEDAVINDHLGDAYWKAGRVTEARFQWRRALSLKPEADLVPKIEAKLRYGLESEEARAERRP
ncbi:MAG: tetratricopeptide repeat protein [Proteobacteria bacterium]|nr:tetratricopeptide repeat protein [Pseudomonadota bacterium]